MCTTPYVIILSLGALVCLAGCNANSDDRINPSPADNRVDADNTGNNRGDGSDHAKTPIDQSESSEDIEVTATIRRAIMDDDSMSINAQNCKIITDETGRVTLRGVVNSQAEKDAIDAKAKAVAGVTRVDNQLEIDSN